VTGIKIIPVVLIGLALLFLSGCWSNLELENRAFVSALGIDKSGDKLRVTAQLLVPSLLGGGQNRAMGTDPNKKNPVFIVETEARTLSEAVDLLSKESGRRLFFPFLQIIVVGEDLARYSILPVTEWVQRDRELRLKTLLGVAVGEAGEVIKAPGAGLERVPGYFLGSSTETANNFCSRVVEGNFLKFIKDLSSRSRDPVALRLATAEVSDQKQARISGSAVFDGYRLAGWLNDRETRGYLWITGDIQRGIISATLPHGESIAFEIRGSDTEIKTGFVDGEPVVDINIVMKSAVNEVHNPVVSLASPRDLDRLEPLVERQVAGEVHAALEKARRLNTDIFGFGEIIHRQHPAEWRRIAGYWDEIFPLLPVQVQVKATIRRTGQIGSPVRPGKPE